MPNRRDYDEAIAPAASDMAKPGYAVTFNYYSSYENRREGDRIIQDANPPIRNNQYNAYAYSPDTFPPASPPLLAPREPAKVSAPVPPFAPPERPAAPKTVSVPVPEPRPSVKPQPRRHAPPRPAHRSESSERFSLFRR